MRELTGEEPVTVTVLRATETRKCDGCGEEISVSWPEGMYAHELIILLDQEECVNFLRERDYCPACLTPLWEAVNRLIGVADAWAAREEGRGEQ